MCVILPLIWGIYVLAIDRLIKLNNKLGCLLETKDVMMPTLSELGATEVVKTIKSKSRQLSDAHVIFATEVRQHRLIDGWYMGW